MRPSKWVDEVHELLLEEWEELPWEKISEILERIDGLLMRAAMDTDDDNLAEEILKEQRDEQRG